MGTQASPTRACASNALSVWSPYPRAQSRSGHTCPGEVVLNESSSSKPKQPLLLTESCTACLHLHLRGPPMPLHPSLGSFPLAPLLLPTLGASGPAQPTLTTSTRQACRLLVVPPWPLSVGLLPCSPLLPVLL